MLEFGIIGVGRFGKHYARLLSNFSGVNLKKTANNSVEAHELLKDKTIDCVIIATPASKHFQLINQAISFGKNVLVEKPMVTTTAEARSLQADLVQKPVIFMVGFQYVYNDYVRCLKKIIEENNVGKILYLLGEHLYCGPIRADIGSFQDAAAHELSIINYLFGPGSIKEINGQSLNFSSLGQDDFTAVTINWVNGLQSHLITSRFAPQKTRRLTIVGDKKTIIFDDIKIEGKISVFDQIYPSVDGFKNTTKSISINSNIGVVPVVEAKEPLYNQIEHFIKCVQQNEQPITNIEFGSLIVEQNEIILKNTKKS